MFKFFHLSTSLISKIDIFSMVKYAEKLKQFDRCSLPILFFYYYYALIRFVPFYNYLPPKIVMYIKFTCFLISCIFNFRRDDLADDVAEAFWALGGKDHSSTVDVDKLNGMLKVFLFIYLISFVTPLYLLSINFSQKNMNLNYNIYFKIESIPADKFEAL